MADGKIVGKTRPVSRVTEEEDLRSLPKLLQGSGLTGGVSLGKGTTMVEAADDVLGRLESVIESWGAELGRVESELDERLARARSRFSPTDAVQDEIESASISLATVQAESAALRAALRECADLARSALERIEPLEVQVGRVSEEMEALHLELPRLIQNKLRGMMGSIEDAVAPGIVERVRRQLESGETTPGTSEQPGDEASECREAEAGPPEETPFEHVGVRPHGESEEFDRSIVAFDAAGHKRKMGEILLDAGLISAPQLERALAIQKAEAHRKLGSILIDLGYTEATMIARVLAAQLKLPYVRLTKDRPQPEAVKKVGGRLAMHHMCIPLRVDRDRLLLAMSNPLDLIAIEDVELASGMRVEPVVAGVDDITRAIEKYYPSEQAI